MPRIRKQTSNRQSISDRHKIQKKVREGRKKKAKQAKKNPQWKSKHKKDPGIPNDFPYKEQILAEVAEQRRIAAEEKEKRKEEKRLARQQDRGDSKKLDDENEGLDETFDSKNLDVGSEAIASLSAKLIDPKLITKEKKAVQIQNNGEEEDVPILANRELPTLKTVLDTSDVLLEVLDARDPLPFRSSYLEKVMQGKKVLLVLNKIDLCPREGLASWLSFLRREYPTFLFRSATAFLPGSLEATAPTQGKGKGSRAPSAKDDALGSEAILSQLSEWASEKGDNPLTVAVAGLTNVGKSCFLNSLLCKASLPVYSVSTSSQGRTTTLLPQDMILVADGTPIRFIDTPGIAWSADPTNDEIFSLEQLRARDMLLRSRGRIDRLKDPSSALSHIVERANAEDLMLMYSLPAFSKKDSAAFLAGVARSNQLVKKRGVLDLAGASKIVLRDWNAGRFVRYTLPPAVDGAAAVSPPSDTDEKILSHTRTRREMRKQGGLVKMLTSGVDSRAVQLESPWEAELERGEENDEMIDQMMDVAVEVAESESGSDHGQEETKQNEDEDSDADEALAEEDLTSPASFPQKRKRAASFTSTQPAKKVAFVSRKQQKLVKSSEKVPQEEQDPKSILKKSTTVTKTKSPGNTKKPSGKVANVAKSLKKRADDTDDPNAYDFTKFF